MKHVVHRSGGYTLIEVVFVMLAMTTLTAGLFIQSLDIYHRYALQQTLVRIEQSLILAKHLSIMNHSRVTLDMQKTSYSLGEEVFAYLGDVRLLHPQHVTYNEHGRVSRATTMTFQCHRYEQAIVIWLGQGVYETTAIRLRAD